MYTRWRKWTLKLIIDYNEDRLGEVDILNVVLQDSNGKDIDPYHSDFTYYVINHMWMYKQLIKEKEPDNEAMLSDFYPEYRN